MLWALGVSGPEGPQRWSNKLPILLTAFLFLENLCRAIQLDTGATTNLEGLPSIDQRHCSEEERNTSLLPEPSGMWCCAVVSEIPNRNLRQGIRLKQESRWEGRELGNVPEE